MTVGCPLKILCGGIKSMQNNFVALAIVLIYFVALFVIAAVSNKIQEKKAKKLGSGGADSFLLAS